MKSHISATEAARKFSDLLNRVQYQGEEFIVERGGEPLCRITPVGASKRTVADLVRVLRSVPKPDEGYWKAVEGAIKSQPKPPRPPWPR